MSVTSTPKVCFDCDRLSVTRFVGAIADAKSAIQKSKDALEELTARQKELESVGG